MQYSSLTSITVEQGFAEATSSVRAVLDAARVFIFLTHMRHIVVDVTSASHDALVGLLMAFVHRIERGNARSDIPLLPVLATVVLGLPVVRVARKVDARCIVIVSEEHVL